MSTTAPKLPLTDAERNLLRKQKIKLAQIADLTPKQLQEAVGIEPLRAKRLVALASFQRIPSVGPRMADDVVSLGYYSLDELRSKSGVELIEELEQLYDCWHDPCVEDTMRLFVHYANNPDSDKQWWDFTEERKAYRAEHGYPPTRPKRAWNEKTY